MPLPALDKPGSKARANGRWPGISREAKASQKGELLASYNGPSAKGRFLHRERVGGVAKANANVTAIRNEPNQ